MFLFYTKRVQFQSFEVTWNWTHSPRDKGMHSREIKQKWLHKSKFYAYE